MFFSLEPKGFVSRLKGILTSRDSNQVDPHLENHNKGLIKIIISIQYYLWIGKL
jgi:hypothetical protein